MSCWRQQALIEAPVEDVWTLVGDPGRYPEFIGEDVAEVTGLPDEIERNDTFRYVSTVRRKPVETTFTVEEYEGMREIKLRCMTTGYYSRWLLTEAQGGTFVDLETGMDGTKAHYRAFDAVAGKRLWRRMSERAIDGVRRVVGS